MGNFDHGLFKPYEKVAYCIFCKETVLEISVTRFCNGDVVCEGCLKNYLESVAGDFVDEYVYNNRLEYLDRWFNGLPSEEKERILRNEYAKRKAQESILGIDDLAKDRVDFCECDNNFLDFVKGKLL